MLQVKHCSTLRFHQRQVARPDVHRCAPGRPWRPSMLAVEHRQQTGSRTAPPATSHPGNDELDPAGVKRARMVPGPVGRPRLPGRNSASGRNGNPTRPYTGAPPFVWTSITPICSPAEARDGSGCSGSLHSRHQGFWSGARRAAQRQAGHGTMPHHHFRRIPPGASAAVQVVTASPGAVGQVRREASIRQKHGRILLPTRRPPRRTWAALKTWAHE